VAPSMSATTSRHGQTPANTAGTPAPQDVSMKRSASALSKGAGFKVEATPKPADGKQMEAPLAPVAAVDPWAGGMINPQNLLANMGFEPGMPNLLNDISMYRSLTPKDTPESIKDSGSSEPNSDISEGAALDIDVSWHNVDSDLLLDLTNASLHGESDGMTLDPSLFESSLAPPPADWEDWDTDFNKPWQLDTSFYSMAV
jgi:hypothetical protein